MLLDTVVWSCSILHINVTKFTIFSYRFIATWQLLWCEIKWWQYFTSWDSWHNFAHRRKMENIFNIPIISFRIKITHVFFKSIPETQFPTFVIWSVWWRIFPNSSENLNLFYVGEFFLAVQKGCFIMQISVIFKLTIIFTFN